MRSCVERHRSDVKSIYNNKEVCLSWGLNLFILVTVWKIAVVKRLNWVGECGESVTSAGGCDTPRRSEYLESRNEYNIKLQAMDLLFKV